MDSDPERPHPGSAGWDPDVAPTAEQVALARREGPRHVRSEVRPGQPQQCQECGDEDWPCAQVLWARRIMAWRGPLADERPS